MSKYRPLAGFLIVVLIFLSIGYVIANSYLIARIFGFSQLSNPDFGFLAGNWSDLRLHRPDDFKASMVIVGLAGVIGLYVGAVLAGEALTRFGETRWQTLADLKANGFFGAGGRSFVLAKTTLPGKAGKYLAADQFPHCLLVAPTGRGKGVGFVIPNLLLYKGSAVVLDVKGENFLNTSRHRKGQGDKIFRFAPSDWDRATHRYNPLDRIAKIENPNRQLMELQLTAGLFLQADNDRVAGLLDGGIDLFVAAGMLAFERGTPTLGEIYRIAASGGDKKQEYLLRSEEVRNPAAKLIFERLASTNNDTLTSYLSLLMTSGLKTWANPAIDAATAVSDFSFRDIRRIPQSIYLSVELDMIKPLAPLIRLFFSDLIASLQAKEPAKDEPWPVMILLDEFDRLGKMPIVAESIKTLRSFGGNLVIVTQTIPAVDEIYGENTRLSLQGGAGIKLYLTPSEEKTVEELSRAVGKTTKRVVTKSRSITANPFKGRTISERTEEVSLLPEDEARRMSLEDVVLVVDAQHPIRAKRIVYHEDPFFIALHKAQTGPHPYPPEPSPEIAELRQEVRKLKAAQFPLPPTAVAADEPQEGEAEAPRSARKSRGPLRGTSGVRLDKGQVVQAMLEAIPDGPQDVEQGADTASAETDEEQLISEIEAVADDLEALAAKYDPPVQLDLFQQEAAGMDASQESSPA